MDGMGDAQMGAGTDIMYDVQTGCMDDAWTSAMTDITHDVEMDCTDDAWTGTMTDIMYNVLMDGDFTRFSCSEFTTVFSP